MTYWKPLSWLARRKYCSMVLFCFWHIIVVLLPVSLSTSSWKSCQNWSSWVLSSCLSSCLLPPYENKLSYLTPLLLLFASLLWKLFLQCARGRGCFRCRWKASLSLGIKPRQREKDAHSFVFPHVSMSDGSAAVMRCEDLFCFGHRLLEGTASTQREKWEKAKHILSI